MGDLRNNAIADMTFEDFKKCVAELKSHNIWVAHLLGGEATLHPQIIDFIEYTASQGMRTALITNLLCSDDFIDFANRNSYMFEPIMVNTDIPGNYKKGHIKVRGIDISIENAKGDIRTGKDDGGRVWESKMNNSYGYFLLLMQFRCQLHIILLQTG